MPDDYASRDEVAALILAEIRRLNAGMALLLARAGFDPRLADLLPLIHAFMLSGAWTAGELLQDARRAGRRDLLTALDAITGERGDPAKRLGRWLERHAGAEVDGFRMARVKREAGAWLYCVESVE